MGKRHAAANAGLERAKADEAIREAETRRTSAERERQLLTSFLGSQEQVSGTGRFGARPETLKYTQRYSIDARTLAEIQQAGQGVKAQNDPFQQAGQNVLELGQGFANRANDLLSQAEAAARAGDTATAERLFAQAQQVISGVSIHAQSAFNLGGGEESAAAIRAGSAEGQIVGRQLLTARELGDPNSATSIGLRSRLLDPTLAAINQGEQGVLSELQAGEEAALAAVDEQARNAERAIAAERGQIDGEIRQRGAGGTGVNARAQLALQSRAGSQAALQRAQVFSQAGAAKGVIQSETSSERANAIAVASQQRAMINAQVDLYLNEFGKRMAEDSVALAQEWVNGTAGVRDIYQESLQKLDIIQAEMSNQWAQIFAAQAEARRKEDKVKKQVTREGIFGFATGALAVSTIFGGGGLGQTASGVEPGGGLGGGGSGLGEEAEAVAGGGSKIGAGGGGGGGGLGALLAFL